MTYTYVGLMPLPPCRHLYPTPADEQHARDLAHAIFGVSPTWPDTCFSELHAGDPWWMVLLLLINPRLVRVWTKEPPSCPVSASSLSKSSPSSSPPRSSSGSPK